MSVTAAEKVSAGYPAQTYLSHQTNKAESKNISGMPVQEASAGEASLQQSSTDQVKLSTSITVKNLDTVKAIEQMHATMNQHIKSVRETNEQLNKTAEQLNAMQNAITSIQKNFPPFSMDSKERQELLMSYTAIRQELMKMTIPQPPAPLYEQVKHQWGTTIGQNGQMMASAVPALDTSSSDAKLEEASDVITNTNNSLAELSSGITRALIGG